MDPNRSHRHLGFIVTVLWISALILILPLPTDSINSFVQLTESEATQLIERESKESGLPPAEIERALSSRSAEQKFRVWIEWLFLATLIVCGVASGIGTIRGHGLAQIGCFVTSSLFLIGWYAVLNARVGGLNHNIVDAYFSQTWVALKTNSFLALLAACHRDLMLPLAHFGVASYVGLMRAKHA